MHSSMFLRSVAILLSCICVFGQTATGVLQGTVTDASGAASDGGIEVQTHNRNDGLTIRRP